MLRDRFVCGLANINVQERLLSEKDLILKRAVAVATAMEMAVLESSDVKKTASGLNSDEEYVNHVDKQTVVQCYCCGKGGIFGVNVVFVPTSATSVVRLDICK